MKKYYSRIIEETIQRKLKSSGAVLVIGPKFCGKTTTCKMFSKSSIHLITDDVIEIASADLKTVLVGEKPRLIDEWQNVPEIWDYVRKQVDEDNEFGEFILTGSATPVKSNKIHHSGSGRIVPIKMRTLSLYETKESNGLVSIKTLFDDSNFNIFDLNENYSLADTAFYMCRGGWPMSINDDRETSLDVTSNYFAGLFNFTNSENVNYKNKKPEVLKMILKSFARNISTQASYQTILSDVIESNSRKMDIKTFDSYLDLAKDLFLIEDMEAWSLNIRSKVSIRTTPTRHFVDTSLACQVLNISPSDLLNDVNTFGLFFEDFAVKELRIYADSLQGELKHYRDSSGLECDCIIHLKDGRWGAIEIKLGSEKGIEEGAKNINKLCQSIDEKFRQPSFKMILTAVGKAYKRKDGIYVIPINMLKN